MLLLLIALALTAVRFVRLDADPPVTKRMGDVANEGYWLHNARLKALTGHFRRDHFNQALVTAPLFTLLAYAVFEVAGVGLASGRLVAALSGGLILLLGFVFLWRGRHDVRWAIAYVLILAVNDMFFAYNRIALVETTLGLFLLASFIAFAVAYQSARPGAALFVSGVCFGLALLVKFTALYIAMSFVAAVLIERAVGRRLSWRALMPWLGGVIGVVTPFVFVIQAFYPGELVRHITIYRSAAVATGTPLYYKLVPLILNPLRVVRNEFVTTLSVALLIVLLVVGLIERTRRVGLRGLLDTFDPFERVCLAWIIGNVVTAAFAELQADRRYWTTLVPIVIVVSRMVFQHVGDGDAGRNPANVRHGAEWTAWDAVARVGLACGAIYALAPLLVAWAEVGMKLLGFGVRLGVVQAGSLAVVGLVVAVLASRGVTASAWYVALVPLLVFAVDWNVGLFVPAARDGVGSILAGTGVACVAAAGIAMLVRSKPRLVFATILGVSFLWSAAVVGQAVAFPQATVPTAAREVDRLVATVDDNRAYYVAGVNAHELALESKSLPLFLGLGGFFTPLTRELSRYPGLAPQYYLEAVSRGSDGAALVRLPLGMDGSVIGTYCGARHRFTGRCAGEVAVVKLTRFSLREYLASEAKETSR